MSKTKTGTPILVALIGALSFLFGILLLVLAAVAFGAITILDDSDLTSAAGVILLILAFVYILFGFGLLKGWSIMWYLGIIIYAVAIVGGLLRLPAGLGAVVVGAIVIYYLTRPKVKNYFLG